MTSPLEQCRDALRDVALDLAVAQQAELTASLGALLPHKHAAAARDRSAIESALAAAEAALAAQPEPVAWAQLGMRNGHTYVRMHYEGHLYPPPPDVQRNLNLVPLYVAPVAAPVAQPLTDEQIRAIHQHLCNTEGSSYMTMARAIERAHGIAPKEPA